MAYLISQTIRFITNNAVVIVQLKSIGFQKIDDTSRLQCNPGTTATDAEAHKIEKYLEVTDNDYIFQPVARVDLASL